MAAEKCSAWGVAGGPGFSGPSTRIPRHLGQQFAEPAGGNSGRAVVHPAPHAAGRVSFIEFRHAPPLPITGGRFSADRSIGVAQRLSKESGRNRKACKSRDSSRLQLPVSGVEPETS